MKSSITYDAPDVHQKTNKVLWYGANECVCYTSHNRSLVCFAVGHIYDLPEPTYCDAFFARLRTSLASKDRLRAMLSRKTCSCAPLPHPYTAA